MLFLIKNIDSFPVAIKHLIMLPAKLLVAFAFVAILAFLINSIWTIGMIGWIVVFWITVIWFLMHLYKDVVNIMNDVRVKPAPQAESEEY